uniref:Carboxypeptidase regulatory-like domain-containing protein n=1 Tax=Strongyloides stercoralis TaxID=6248 RepID=A0A0K0E990_STRER
MIRLIILNCLVIMCFSYHLNNISPGGIFKGIIKCFKVPLNNTIVTIYERESFTFVSNKTNENGSFELDVDKNLNNFLDGYLEFYYNCPGYNEVEYLEVNLAELIRNPDSYLRDKIYYFGILDLAEVNNIKNTID